jgi:hypothetical protein
MDCCLNLCSVFACVLVMCKRDNSRNTNCKECFEEIENTLPFPLQNKVEVWLHTYHHITSHYSLLSERNLIKLMILFKSVACAMKYVTCRMSVSFIWNYFSFCYI